MVDSVLPNDVTWAVIYIVGCRENPYTKVPLVPNTVLAAQAVVGVTQEGRLMNCNGSIANNITAQYKIYMFCGPEYFTHLDNIVDLLNAYYSYLRYGLPDEVDTETAFAISTAIFPARTSKDVAMHANLMPIAIKTITRSKANLMDIKPIRFNPRPVMSEDVVK